MPIETSLMSVILQSVILQSVILISVILKNFMLMQVILIYLILMCIILLSDILIKVILKLLKGHFVECYSDQLNLLSDILLIFILQSVIQLVFILMCVSFCRVSSCQKLWHHMQDHYFMLLELTKFAGKIVQNLKIIHPWFFGARVFNQISPIKQFLAPRRSA